MGYTFFAISAYVFMRAFEVLFGDKKNKDWYKVSIKVISAIALYAGFAAMLWFYFNRVHLLGFDPK